MQPSPKQSCGASALKKLKTAFSTSHVRGGDETRRGGGRGEHGGVWQLSGKINWQRNTSGADIKRQSQSDAHRLVNVGEGKHVQPQRASS